MINEVKSGEQVVATITQRHVIAFQINIPGTFDMQSLDVPVWANTLAIDEDGSILAYESTSDEVRIMGNHVKAWCDGGTAKNRMEQIGKMHRVPDWEKTKVDLRGLK